jgi:drug/metabolite transporter (DMT)-like permease
MNLQSNIPDGLPDKAVFLVKLILTDGFILSGFLSAFVASIFWMAAMSKFAISFAYPFMSSAFIFVMLGSAFLFGEQLNTHKILGTLIIVVGIVVLSKGQ